MELTTGIMIHIRELAPITLFTYNRLWHTQQTIKYLSNNQFARDSMLYVFSDGPKDEEAKTRVKEVRQFLTTITGFKDVIVTERNDNLGLAKSITNGVTEIVKRHGKVIVLEDDLLTSPFFLKYMNEALKMYQYDEKVASIHGYTYPVKEHLPDTFFIKGADCWGWATWERAWNIYEKAGEKLLHKLKEKGFKKEFNFNNSYGYINMLKKQIKGKNDSWAIIWYASTFLRGMYTLYPFPSLVMNIGHDNSGTHSGISYKLGDTLKMDPVIMNRITIEENGIARKAFENYFRSLSGIKSLIERIRNYLISLLKI